MKNQRIYTYAGGAAVLLAIILSLSAVSVRAQEKSEKQTKKTREFCSDYNYYTNDDKVSFRETREITVPAASLLTVDGRRNGGVRVVGVSRSDVLIRACVQTRGATNEEARSMAQAVQIATAGGNVRAEGGDESSQAVSFEISVPRSTNLKLTTQNGGISIQSVEGAIEFTAQNGGISLNDIAGSVKGRTTNGGVSIALSGNSWKGGGLDVETTNGGVHLAMPETYAAHVETGTVNGGFKSDVSGLNFERNEDERGRRRPSRISTDLNGGGAPVRVVTTNGGIKISSVSEKTF